MTDGPRRRPAAKPAAARARKAAPRKAAPRKATAGAAAPRKATASRTAASRQTAPRKAAAPRQAGASRKAAPRPGRRIAAGLVVSVLLVGFLLIGVFPTRTWLDQREERGARQAELDRIRAEQEGYEARIEELQDPDEIEAIARHDLGLTMPGEDAYQMLPAPVPPVDLPDTWPFTGAADWLNR